MTEDIGEIRQLIDEFNSFLSDAEGLILYKLGKNLLQGQSGVIIGNREALVWLAKGTVAGNGNRVYYFTPPGTGDPGVMNMEDTLSIMLTRAGIRDTVAFISNTYQKMKVRQKGKVGLLFICGAAYEETKGIILDWQSNLTPEAKVLFHRCDLPDTARVIKECLGEQGDFRLWKIIDTLTVITIDKCTHHWIINSGDKGICKYCKRHRDFKRILKDLQKRNIKAGKRPNN